MPICQGTVREALRQGLVTGGFQTMETETTDFTVNEDGVSQRTMPQKSGASGDQPSGSVVSGAPVTNSVSEPPPVARATGDDELADQAKDIFDNPEKVISQLLEQFRMEGSVSGTVDESGNFNVHFWFGPEEGGAQPIGTPTATSETAPAGRAIVSSSSGYKIVQEGEGAPVLTKISGVPVATQATSGAGNTVISNLVQNGDVKLNALFNAIGFLALVSAGFQVTFNLNLGAGAGARTNP
jgi:hypothetical protein